MKRYSSLRVVGWGPLKLPFEGRRWEKALDAADELLASTGRDRKAEKPGATSSTSGSDDSTGRDPSPEMPIGRKYKFRLQGDGASSCQIGLITGDMFTVTTVAIWVNPENTDMWMDRPFGGTVSANLRYYGAERGDRGRGTAKIITDLIADHLESVVGNAVPVAPGSAFVTRSGELEKTNKVRRIIHVATVEGRPGIGFRSVDLLNVGRCVTNVLAKVDEIAGAEPELNSVLIPLLGTGVGGANVDQTVSVLVNSAISYLEEFPNTDLRNIYFLAYNEEEFRALLSFFDSNARVIPAGEFAETEVL